MSGSVPNKIIYNLFRKMVKFYSNKEQAKEGGNHLVVLPPPNTSLSDKKYINVCK